MKNKRIFYLLLIVLLFLSIGTTYAYFYVNVTGNEEAEGITATVGTLELFYEDDQQIIGDSIFPGWSETKKIVITNVGTLETSYKIFWDELVNTIELDELSYMAECKEYINYGSVEQEEKGPCEGINPLPVPAEVGTIANRINIKPGYTQEYNFSFNFEDLPVLQNYNQNKQFFGKFSITDATDDEAELPRMYKLLIDPNGGIYPGRVLSYHEEGTVVDIDTPTSTGHTFSYWKVNGLSYTDDMTFTMENKTLSLQAQWDLNEGLICRIGRAYYLSLVDALSVVEDGDTIEILRDVNEDITIDNNITLDLGYKTIYGTIINNGNLTILHGTIESDDTGIVNNGEIILGDNQINPSIALNNDFESKISNVSTYGIEKKSYSASLLTNKLLAANISATYEQFDVIVVGDSVGIDQNGILTFNRAYVTGDVAVDGLITRVLEEHYIKIQANAETAKEEIVLEELPPSAILKTVVGGDVLYMSLQEAIEATEETGYTIYAIKNFTDSINATIPSSRVVSLDLNGKTATFTGTFNNGGTLNTSNGTIKVSSTFNNYGTMSLSNINMSFTNTDITSTLVVNYGNISISNSDLMSNKGYALNNSSDGQYNITNRSTIKAFLDDSNYNYGIYDVSKRVSTITDSDVYGIRTSSVGITINGNSVIHIPGSSYYGLYMTASTSRVTFNDGLITSDIDSNWIYPVYVGGGILTINGGDITSSYSRAFHMNGGTTNFYGGNITSTKDDGTGVYIGSGTFNMYGGTINSSGIEGTGVYTGGAFRMYGGTIDGGMYGLSVGSNTTSLNDGIIRGGQYGIYHNGNGTLNIGDSTNGSTNSSPSVYGEEYGLYIFSDSWTTYFKDGLLKGKLGGYYGIISNPLDDHEVNNTTVAEGGITYNTSQLETRSNFISVDGVEYNSFDDAIDSMGSSGEIILLKNVNGVNIPQFPMGVDITLDLNGHTLMTTFTLVSKSNLIIEDSSLEKSGMLLNTKGRCITSNTMDTLTLNDVLIRCSHGEGIRLDKGSLVLNNARIESDGNGIYTSTNAGTIKTIDMNGGYINSTNGIGAYLYAYGVLNLNSGTITSNYMSRSGVETYSTGDINISGGTIQALGGNSNGIKTGTTGTEITMSNGNVTGTLNGMLLNSGNATITGGTIEGNTNGIRKTAESVLTIGNNLDAINIDNPIIRSNGNGLLIEGTGDTNFYDGVLEGKSNSYSGTISNIIPNTEIYDSQRDDYNISFLIEEGSLVQSLALQYKSINAAINNTNDGTIVIKSDSMITENIVVPKDKTITIDLNGFELSTIQPIENNGTLIIEDTSENERGLIENNINDTINNNGNLIIKNGTISSKDGNAINLNDNATLTIGNDDDRVSSEYPIISGSDSGINTTSNNSINYYDGTIEGTDPIEISSSLNNASVVNNTNSFDDRNSTYLITTNKYLKVNNSEYNSFNKAIESNNNTTIKLTSNAVTNETIVIPKDKKITIDMNGYSLELTKNIINNGELSIINNSDYDSVINSINSNLIITTKDSITKLDDATFKANKSVIYMMGGTTYVNSGVLEGKEYGIYVNDKSAKLTIGSEKYPTVKGNYYGVYINETSEFNFINGLIGGITDAYFGKPTNKISSKIIDDIDGNYIIKSYKR